MFWLLGSAFSSGLCLGFLLGRRAGARYAIRRLFVEDMPPEVEEVVGSLDDLREAMRDG